MGIKIWTDGSCTGAGKYEGIGAYAFKIESNELSFEEAVGVLDTTNNRMEIEAVIKAFATIYDYKHIFTNKNIVVYADSSLVVNTLKKENPWKRKKNHDKWDAVDEVIAKLEKDGFKITFQWVQAHTKNIDEISVGNRKVDKMATEARDRTKIEFDKVMDMVCMS